MNEEYDIYTDSSIQNVMNEKIGIGCYYIPTLKDDFMIVKLKTHKSTYMEIYTTLIALDDLSKNVKNIDRINIYTDCQGLCRLIERRNKIMQKFNDKNDLHNLYIKYYEYVDKYDIITHKIKGHTKKTNRITIHEKIFDKVDKITRKYI